MNSAAGLRDAAGQWHQPYLAGAPRIVSLVPSITELLFDLGLGAHLVGRTGFCIHPAAGVRDIPKVGGTKNVNLEKVRQLAPTHLIVNIDENEKPTVELLAQYVPHIIVTHPLTPRDNLALYRLLGGIFGVTQAAQRLCAGFGQAYAALPAAPAPQQVLYCIWRDPWMTVAPDTYISAMLALIGWQTWSPGDSAQRYPQFSWNDEGLQHIDRVLLSTEPYRFTAQHAAALAGQLGKPVQLLDGEMISWYGSRAIAGLRYLARL
ncbi:MAG: ABC transporter substrate-binding protein [Burkholderiales bacterium]|nr:ABC transporter substrate-binding protein [Burkholderiales bacterium]